MATFQERVEDYIGSFTDTTALTEWLTSGARYIVDLLPEDMLNEQANAYSVTTNGLALSSYRIWQALKNGYEARRVPTGLYTAVQDTNSMHCALNNSPVSVVYDQKIYIFPNGGEVLAILYPTVTYSATTISGLPTRMQHAVVLFTIIQALLKKSSDALASVGAVSLPTVPNTPSYSFTNINSQTVTLPTLSTYTKPTTTFSTTQLNTYTNSTTAEDLDQATAEANHQRMLLEKFQMDLYNELNEVNAEIESIRIQLQKNMKDAELSREAGIINSTKELEAEIAEYQSILAKYQSQIQAYGSQINAGVNLVQGYVTLLDKIKVEFNEFIQNNLGSKG